MAKDEPLDEPSRESSCEPSCEEKLSEASHGPSNEFFFMNQYLQIKVHVKVHKRFQVSGKDS